VEVRTGDTLGKLAKRHGTTADLLRRANGIRGDVIQPGQRLKSPVGRFSVHVDKGANRLELRLDGGFFKAYSVATGANNYTPVGEFHITDRVERPTWWRPSDGAEIPYGDPEHKIGTHWLAWDRKGFGIHGTDEPETIGQQVSLGCVRMRNEEVGELFLLLPVGTPVSVRD
jgi:lipoprotein-anchoring transpeptidase ErfK/SrfK